MDPNIPPSDGGNSIVLDSSAFSAIGGGKKQQKGKSTKPAPITVQGHIGKLQNLLEIEREAEVAESEVMLAQFSFKELEKRNLAITKLFIDHISTGVYGRTLLHLKKRDAKPVEDGKNKDGAGQDEKAGASKMRKFSPGDIVGVFQSSGQAVGA